MSPGPDTRCERGVCPLCDLGRKLDPWTRGAARLDPHGYADAVSGAEEPCEHGHLGCATHEGGPCVDEVLTDHEARGGCDDCEWVEVSS